MASSSIFPMFPQNSHHYHNAAQHYERNYRSYCCEMLSAADLLNCASLFRYRHDCDANADDNDDNDEV